MIENGVKKYNSCRFCMSSNLLKVINLGKMPLAGGFIKNRGGFTREKKYPLALNFCKDCYLLQTSISINPDILFKKYFYFSSTINTLTEHFNAVAKELKKILKKESFVVEIGSNDGGFIKALRKEGYKALGVDPASNIVKPLIKEGLPIINNYFSVKVAKKIIMKYGNCDVIYSFHTLAHIPDMRDVISGIKLLLKPQGYLAFEVHYLGNLIDEMQYDMIYHEHLHYYSLLTLEKFFSQYDMEVFHVERNNQRAGSITYFVQNKGNRKIKSSVRNLKKKELKMGLNKQITYLKFNTKITKTKNDLLKLLNKLNKEKIAGYGASGRGTVVSNFIGLGIKKMRFVVDDSIAKQGNFMPGTHNPIYSPKKLLSEGISYAIVFAWPFIDEVLKRNKTYIKNGGRFIVPLPKVKILK